MGEIWAAAAVTIVGGVIAGKAAEKKDKSDKKYNTQMTEMDYRKQAQQTGYESALQDYYKQKDRFEAQRGMDQFRNFSTIQNYSPGSSQYDGQLAAPVMPKYADFSNEEPEDEKKSSGGKSGVGGLL